MSKRQYIKKILKILRGVNDLWVLDQICRFTINMTEV